MGEKKKLENLYTYTHTCSVKLEPIPILFLTLNIFIINLLLLRPGCPRMHCSYATADVDQAILSNVRGDGRNDVDGGISAKFEQPICFSRLL